MSGSLVSPRPGSGAPTGDGLKDVLTLVVDDELQMRLTVAAALEGQGFSVVLAESGEEALQAISRQPFDLAVVDLNLPGVSGLEVLRAISEIRDRPEMVVLTGQPDLESAVEAMKVGAFDYISKPFDPLKLVAVLSNAATKRRLARENATLREVVQKQGEERVGQVVADSSRMREVLEVADRVAASNASVLIQGETGTGKGLMAKILHSGSHRSGKPQLHINCSAFNEQLLESELFGYEKGAFTGAVESKLGLFEVADGGTLFLDEVAEMSPAMQAKLLLVLDSGELRRVGGTSFARVDVRILAATNRDLEREVRAGRFREDLMFRLNVVKIELPPLRLRSSDIPGLVELYLDRHRLPDRARKTISKPALEALRAYRWPGNVRELANVIEGMILMAPGREISLDDLPPAISGRSQTNPEPDGVEPDGPPASLAEVQRIHIERVLRYTEGKKAPAARLLGIDVKTLYAKIKAYDLDV